MAESLVERLKEAHMNSAQHTLGSDIFLEAAIAVENAENVQKLYEYELNERMNIFAATLRTMTNGDWDKLKALHPDLHAFIKQAVNR